MLFDAFWWVFRFIKPTKKDTFGGPGSNLNFVIIQRRTLR